MATEGNVDHQDNGHKKKTTFNELLTAAKANIPFIFTPWLDCTNRGSYSGHGLILDVSVDTIFSSWEGCSTTFVDYDLCSSTNSTSKRMLEIFEFLDMDKARARCAVVITSKEEWFNRPFFFVDFELLFGLCRSTLKNESFVLAVLHLFNNDEEHLRTAWERGVMMVTYEFLGEEVKYLIKYELSEVKELVVKLAEERDFFVSDITRKAREPDHKGFGVSEDFTSVFLGFILFVYEDINEAAKTVTLHIEYLLCRQGRGGTGLQLVNLAIQQCQSDYPGYTISAFAEAKPNGTAPNFWLKKLNFSLDDEVAIPDVYLPAYKIYPGHRF